PRAAPSARVSRQSTVSAAKAGAQAKAFNLPFRGLPDLRAGEAPVEAALAKLRSAVCATAMAQVSLARLRAREEELRKALDYADAELEAADDKLLRAQGWV
ncbi:unnamed protein product, partial [Polarella glacialis]